LLFLLANHLKKCTKSIHQEKSQKNQIMIERKEVGMRRHIVFGIVCLGLLLSSITTQAASVALSVLTDEMQTSLVLAGWVLEEGLPVRVQLQIHKYIWGDHARGV
jgi:organic radical activating enzyme